VFRALADIDVNVDMIVQNVSDHGVTDISFTVPHGELVEARQIAESLAGDLGASGVSVDDSIARVSVVGAGMRTNPGVAATMFETLAGEGINIAMISTSAIRVSCVVDGDRVEDAVRTLHDVFGLSVG
jgi:aspartate kinase